MNEEEKKAVEFVKKRTKELKKYAKRENELVYDDIILNLINKLQKENEELKNQEATQRKINELLVQRYSNSISVQKVKDKIEEVQKEYNKLDKQVDEYINDANKDLSKYYENKEKIGTMQTLAWVIDNLQELLEGRK